MKITLTKPPATEAFHLRYDGREFTGEGGISNSIVASALNAIHDGAGRHEPLRDAAGRALRAWTDEGWSAEITAEDADADEFGEDVIH